jgi:TolB-like protein/Tfp pilus assembly protein PilF
MNSRNFFAELKRRNVYKVAVAYAIVGWLSIQIATQVFPFLEIPNWVVRLVIAAVAIGFPIALVIAWAFELTPEGIKRTKSTDAARHHSRGGVWIAVVVIAAALSIGLFFLGRYTAFRKQTESAELPQKSIAVLPFENLSRDPDNAYFADGIQEEILTRLAKIADLKVISRTSTQQFQSKPANLSIIAKQLGVANILQGSVQRSSDQVRVNVQLIKAATDAHLWAETFDRKLTDVFAVETDIAKTIADTLHAKLTGSEERAIAIRPTQNPKAYELYLRGRFFWNKRTAADLKKSIDYFNQAIEEDPNYALAYAGLADAWSVLPVFGGGAPKDCGPRAEAAARRAIQLDETLAEPHASLGLLLSIYYFDFFSSIRELERAIQLNSNYAMARHWLGNLPLTFTGQFARATSELKRALELDPLSMIINANFGQTYCYSRRYEEAIVQLRKTIELDPGFYYAHYLLGQALELKGDRDAAIAEYQKARELNDDPLVLALLAQAMAKAGNKAQARTMLEELQQESKHRYVAAYGIGLLHLGLGEKEEALRWFEKSYEDHAGTEIGYIKVDPFLDSLRGDSRFEALVQKVVEAKQ